MSKQARVVMLAVMACGLGAVIALRDEPPRSADIAAALVFAAAGTLGMHFAQNWARAHGVNQAVSRVLLFVGVIAMLVVALEGFILVTKWRGLPAG